MCFVFIDIFEFNNAKFLITICEDAWHNNPSLTPWYNFDPIEEAIKQNKIDIISQMQQTTLVQFYCFISIATMTSFVFMKTIISFFCHTIYLLVHVTVTS